MKIGLSMRVAQSLTLTPQLQQSIRLLQLSSIELEQEVAQMLASNPFLESADAQAEGETPDLAQTDAATSEQRGDLEHEAHSPATADLSPAQAPDHAINPATALETALETTLETAPASDFDTPYSASAQPSHDTASPAEAPAQDELQAPNWEGDGSADQVYEDGENGENGNGAGESGNEAPARNNGNSSPSDDDAIDLARAQERLSDFLLRQVCGLRICAEDRAALEYLIGSLNEDGYLEDSLETLAQALGPENEAQQLELLHHLTVAHSLLLHCEPTGIGARNLAECLQLQLQAQQATPATEPHTQPIIAAALRICAQPLELLARRDIKQCVQRGVGNAALVRLAFAHIARLEPKPARQFVDVQRNIIVPDVLVRARRNARGLQQSGFEVQLNPAVMPRLQANSLYAKVLQEHRGSATSSAHAANSAHTANIANTAHAAGTAPTQGYAALQQNLQEARWFIKSIQQRFDTILRVCNAIVERQKGFLTHGEMAMRPLVMREIAEALDLHESTISRVVTAKYMSTPFGTYELRYFFGSSLTTDTGGNASSTAVRALIKQFIASENPTKPLSDQHIADLLEAQGIACARRTVAKYREGLKIATASLRKAL